MKRAEPLPEVEKLFVVDREQRSLQRREHRQLIVRPFDGCERGADGFNFLPSVERLAADQQVRNPTGLDGFDVRARHVSVVARETPEQYRNVLRPNRDAALGPIRLSL